MVRPKVSHPYPQRYMHRKQPDADVHGKKKVKCAWRKACTTPVSCIHTECVHLCADVHGHARF